MTSRRQQNLLHIQRSIHFYRVDAGNDEDGKPIVFDPTEILNALDGLDYQDLATAGPFLDSADGNAFCCWVDKIDAPQRMRYVRIRKTGLPSLLQSGTLGPLNIPLDAGLAEEIHLVFFEKNMVGSDFNFFGPRVSTLGYYLRSKAPGIGVPCVFEPLINGDVTSKLNRLSDISLLTLHVRPSFASTIGTIAPDLAAGIQALERAGQSERVDLTLRANPYSKATLSSRLLPVVRGLMGLENVREHTSKIVAKGFDDTLHRNAVVDLLSDRFITSKTMVKQDERSRAVTTESAYRAIAEAYQELSTDLNLAASLRV